MLLVKPDTVVRWHKDAFRRFWRRKSKGQPGRPPVERVVRDQIRRMADENPLWGAPRIRSELRLLGHKVAQSTVAKYLPRKRKPPRKLPPEPRSPLAMACKIRRGGAPRNPLYTRNAAAMSRQPATRPPARTGFTSPPRRTAEPRDCPR